MSEQNYFSVSMPVKDHARGSEADEQYQERIVSLRACLAKIADLSARGYTFTELKHIAKRGLETDDQVKGGQHG